MSRKTSRRAAGARTRLASQEDWPHIADEIRRGAYLNYRQRIEAGLPGSSFEDWLLAERAVLTHHGIVHAERRPV